jgi:hypothetical protein
VAGFFGEGGLLDAVGKVVIKYTADISGMKASLRELDGAQKTQADNEVRRQEGVNRTLKGVGTGIENINAHVKALKVAWDFAQAGVEAYAKKFPDDDRLKSWNAGVRDFGAAWDGVKETIGSIVLMIAPVVEGLGAVAKWVTSTGSGAGWSILRGEGKVVNGQWVQNAPAMSAAAFAAAMEESSAFERERMEQLGGVSGRSVSGYSGEEAEMMRRNAARGAARRVEEEAAAKDLASKLAALNKMLAADWEQIRKLIEEDHRVVAAIHQQAMYGALPSAGGAGAGDLGFNVGGLNGGSAFDAINGRVSGGGGGFMRVSTESRLEAMFGPIEEFNAYTEGFNALGSAVTAAFGAWIDGTSSFGDAFKRAMSESLKATATAMLGQALFHGAYALGELAFGRPDKAAIHGIAAAKFGASAIAVGALAKGLGGGAASSSSGASAGAGLAPGIGGGGEQGRRVTVVIGHNWEDDDPRRKAARIRGAIDRADRLGGDTSAVRYG